MSRQPCGYFIFCERPTAAKLNPCISTKSKSPKGQMESTLTLYCEAVTYALETYTGDNVVADTETHRRGFIQT